MHKLQIEKTANYFQITLANLYTGVSYTCTQDASPNHQLNPSNMPPRTISQTVAAPATPARRRAPVAPQTAPGVPAEIQKLAAEYFSANVEANAFKAKADKARKALLKTMTEAGLTSADIDMLGTAGTMIPLQAVIATPDREEIDVALLRKQVTDDVFMKIVSATKTAVTEHAGSAVVTTCTVVSEGTTNVTVKVRK